MISCVFCKRVSEGQFDQYSDACVSFEPLNPVTPGHLLVVSKLHVTSAIEQPWITGETVRFAAHLAGSLFDSANIITSIGVNATQSVNHLHVHIVPRRVNDGLHLPWTGQVIA